jgi:hypothetical protein
MNSTEYTPSSLQRRLNTAVEYVENLWFPASKKTVRRVKGLLEKNYYYDKPEELYKDIRSDLSLFLFCLKSLSQSTKCSMSKSNGIYTSQFSPYELITKDRGVLLREILSNMENLSLSHHSLESTTKLQSKKFEEVLVSASAAEVLSDSFGIDTELGFSSAVIRQMGLILIAYNYPTVFEDAAKEISESADIDIILANKLGFSPELLVVHLLDRWGLNIPVRDTFTTSAGASRVSSASSEWRKISENLSELCRIGEALARANNPEMYPSAVHDWDDVQKELDDRLGKEWLKSVRNRVKDNCKSYMVALPEIFETALVIDPAKQISLYSEAHVRTTNKYSNHCKGEVKELLQRLYRKIEKQTGVQDCLGLIVKEIIPKSGFIAGCIYTPDPGIHYFIPQLKIGKLKLKEIKNIHFDEYDNPIIKSGINRDLVTEIKKTGFQEEYAGISGPIGDINLAGVLYLEIPYESFLNPDIDYLVHFNAIAKALADSLKV